MRPRLQFSADNRSEGPYVRYGSGYTPFPSSSIYRHQKGREQHVRGFAYASSMAIVENKSHTKSSSN